MKKHSAEEDILVLRHLTFQNDFWRNDDRHGELSHYECFSLLQGAGNHKIKEYRTLSVQRCWRLTANAPSVFCYCSRTGAETAAAGSYEHIPSEKSIRSDSRGLASESTDCGSDLLYCLIKINLVCPMVRMKDGTSNRRSLSISSFLTIEGRRQRGEIRLQQGEDRPSNDTRQIRLIDD